MGQHALVIHLDTETSPTSLRLQSSPLKINHSNEECGDSEFEKPVFEELGIRTVVQNKSCKDS